MIWASTGCNDSETFLRVVEETKIALSEVPKTKSNITFNNQLNDAGHLNAFTWNVLYNGAGVGLADFDNDGLLDIYFAGNQVPDAIYQNKGDLVFEDKTKDAGIVKDNTWSTGVSIVDINQDGFDDIYVCKHSYAPGQVSKTNLLYINQGDFTFVESAKKYGLADDGFSVQATFVDIDQDNDLDCYLINQRVDKFTQILFPQKTYSDAEQREKLYLNDGSGNFQEALGKIPVRSGGYGLNVLAADFDDNGYSDIHVSTDYKWPDALIMNRGGKLTDEATSRFNHTSFFSMGSDVADIDRDGDLDLFCADMAYESHYRSKANMEQMDTKGFEEVVDFSGLYQFMINTLQINNGNGYFQEVAQAANLQSSDWSWSTLFVDFDFDGHKDLFVTNGIVKDVKNNDLREFGKEQFGGNITPQNYKVLYDKFTSYPVLNKLYKNLGDYQFDAIEDTVNTGVKGFSTGAAYGDLDNDGDIDLVISNTNAPATILENTSAISNSVIVKLNGPKGNRHGIGASIHLFTSEGQESATILRTRGYLSSSDPIGHFGIPNGVTVDSLVIKWNALEQTVVKSPTLNKVTTVSYQDLSKAYTASNSKKLFLATAVENISAHKENTYNDYQDQILLPHSISQNGPTVFVSDFNEDGLDDIFRGSSMGNASMLYFQKAEGGYQEVSIDNSIATEDGQMVQFGNQYFITHGSGQHPYNSPKHGLSKLIVNGQSAKFVKQQITAGDFFQANVVGQDLWLFGRVDAAQYPSKTASYCYTMSSSGQLTLKQTLETGMVNDAKTVDIDNDGDLDMVLVGEWMRITYLINDGDRYAFKIPPIPREHLTGLYSTVEVDDINNDGALDLILGNLGRNNKFKPSQSKPFYSFSADFDDDGTNDVVLAKTENKRVVPIRGKQCSSQEIAFVNDKFKDFESFARADLFDIYGQAKLEDSKTDTIFSLTSKVLLNRGSTYEAIEFPIQAQFSPIKDMIVYDINKDGHQDIIFSGNQYGVEVETVRYDAGRGGILLGNGDGSFDFVSSDQSGIEMNGDFRYLDTLTVADKFTIVASQNSGPLRFWTKSN